mgnify:CR=1 FL=1
MCGPIERRASKIHRDYVKKASNVDRDFNGWPPGGPPGPVLRKLQEYGQVRPLVIGPFAEINKDFDKLLVEFANFGAEGSWRMMGARSIKEARACNIAYLRRSVGICAVRQNARLKDLALGYSLGDTKAAFSRRLASMNKAEQWHQEYVRFASSGGRRFT